MSSPKKLRREKSAARRRARKRMKAEVDQPMTNERGATPEGRRPAGTRPQADPAPLKGGAGGEASERKSVSGEAPLDPEEADVSGGHISKHGQDIDSAKKENDGSHGRRERRTRFQLTPGGLEDRSGVPRDDKWRRALRKHRPALGMVNRRYMPDLPEFSESKAPWSTSIDTRDDFIAAELDRMGLSFTAYYGNFPAWDSRARTPDKILPDNGLGAEQDSFLDAVVLDGVKPDLNLAPPKKRWRSGWGSARLAAEDRTWAEGWDRHEYCPIDPKQDATPGASARGRSRKKKGWRNVGGVATEKYRGEHDARRKVVRNLRPAGYIARRYSRAFVAYEDVAGNLVEHWLYTDGPLAGQRAIDPWIVCEKMARCCSQFLMPLGMTKNLELVPVPTPTYCGQHHLCPVCAPRRSRALATLLRGAIPMVAPDSLLALATLTQRDDPDESGNEAINRWLAAWNRIVRGGRANGEFKEYFLGYYRGIEVTRGEHNKWWHSHGHILLVLQPGVSEEEAREWLGRRWRDATEAVRPGWGWNPHSGGCSMDHVPLRVKDAASLERLSVRALRGLVARHGLDVPKAKHLRRAELVPAVIEAAAAWNVVLEQRGDHYRDVTSWDGAWWRSIDPEDPKEIYQAAKYPTPAVMLDSERLVEFLSFARGRRWHQGGGCLREMRKLAALVEAEQKKEDNKKPSSELLDLIGFVALGGPRHTPNLDEVAPDLGWEDGSVQPLSSLSSLGRVTWTVSNQYSEPYEYVDPVLYGAVEKAGGSVSIKETTGQWQLHLPKTYVARRVRRVSALMAARRSIPDEGG